MGQLDADGLKIRAEWIEAQILDFGMKEGKAKVEALLSDDACLGIINAMCQAIADARKEAGLK